MDNGAPAPEPFEIESGSIHKSVHALSKPWSRRPWSRRRRRCVILFFTIIVGIIAICITILSITNSFFTPSTDVEKSELDADMQYQFSRLDTGLHLLVGSKENTNIGSASVCLGLGYLSEPKEMPGLIELLSKAIFEHIKFGAWAAQHVGSLGYSFRETSTCISFDSDASSFPLGLEYFVDALKNPSFDEATISRNIDLLDVPDHAPWTQGHLGRLAVWLRDMNPAHPECFHQGPAKKLMVPGIQATMLEWYNWNFDAHDLAVVVISPVSVSVMTDQMKQLWSKLPGTLDKPPTPRGPEYVGEIPPFLPGKFPGFIYRMPRGDTRALDIFWVLSEYSGNLWRSKPWIYAMEALRWEGEGGPEAYLKQQGWAEIVDAGIDDKGTYTVFQIFIDLTPEGVEHIIDVGAVVFEYISFLRSRSEAEVTVMLQDQRDMRDFRFQLRKYMTWNDAGTLAQNMLDYPEKYVLSGPVKIFDVDPAADLKLVGELTLESARVMLTAPEVAHKCTEEEPIFKRKFHKEQIQGAMRDAWDAAAQGTGQARMISKRLLPKNPYVPVDTTLVADTHRFYDFAKQVFDHLKVISLTHLQFLDPMIYTRIRIFSSVFHKKDKDEMATASVRAKLWSTALSKEIGRTLHELFSMPLTEYELRVETYWGAVDLDIHAPGDLMQTALKNLGHVMRSSDIGTKPSSKSFVKAYSRIRRNLKENSIPYASALPFELKRLFTDYIPPQKELSALATFKEGAGQVPQWLFERSSVEVLMVGNILPRRAGEWSQEFVQELRMSGPELLQSAPRMALSFKAAKTFLKVPGSEPGNPVSTLFIHIQVEPASSADYTLIFSDLLLQILHDRWDRSFPQGGFDASQGSISHLENVGQHWLVFRVRTHYAAELAMKFLHVWIEETLEQLAALDLIEFDEQKAKFLRRIARSRVGNLEQQYVKFSKEFSQRRFSFDTMKFKRGFVRHSRLSDLVNFVGYVQGGKRLYLEITKTSDQEAKEMPQHLLDRLNTPKAELKYDKELEGLEQAFNGSWFAYVHPKSYESDLSKIGKA